MKKSKATSSHPFRRSTVRCCDPSRRCPALPGSLIHHASRPHAYSVRSGPHFHENESMRSTERNHFRPANCWCLSLAGAPLLPSFLLITIPYTPIRRPGRHAQPSYALVAVNPVHIIITVAQALGRLSGAITAVMTASNSA